MKTSFEVTPAQAEALSDLEHGREWPGGEAPFLCSATDTGERILVIHDRAAFVEAVKVEAQYHLDRAWGLTGVLAEGSR